MNPRRQTALQRGALASLVALIVLGIAWETVLAPVRPGVFWPAVKVLPLLLPLRGVWRRDIYTMQWSSMLILLYFMEGIVRGWSDSGLSAWLGWLEAGLVTIFFVCIVSYLRPYKQAARARASGKSGR